MPLTLAVPTAIICVYSILTRGAYGGVERPFTLENYTRLFDPLYAMIFVRSFWIAGVATALCLVLGISAGAVHCANRVRARICI